MNFFHLREPFSAWSHGIWLLLSVPATLLLLRRSVGNLAKRFTFLIYGLSLTFCYAASMLFHGVPSRGDWLSTMNRLDHIGIFVLIAGSYTPLAWCLLRGRWRWGTLTAAWLVTALATVWLLILGDMPSVLATCLYLGMGWGVAALYFEIARVLSHRAMMLMVVGGLSYSVGAVLNLLKWPVLWQGVFHAHELFHLFVMAGTLAHFWFMLTILAPMTVRDVEVSSTEPAIVPTRRLIDEASASGPGERGGRPDVEAYPTGLGLDCGHPGGLLDPQQVSSPA